MVESRDSISTEPTRAYVEAMEAVAAASNVRPTPRDAFARAREMLRHGERIDMGVLASDLGIGRATLYRWTGDRNRLLSDVIWAELDELLTWVTNRTSGAGVDFLYSAVTEFLERLTSGPALRQFLANEGEAGMRLVTDVNGGVRPRLVQAIAGVFDREADQERYRLPDDAAVLADGILTIAERFLYHGGAVELNPDPETARRVIGLLLREASEADR